MRLWEQFDRFERGTNFGAWARAIAHYEVLSHRKRASRARMHFSQEFVEAVQAEYNLHQSENLQEQRRAALANCLEKLPPGQREILNQAYQEQRSIKHLAVFLKRPVGAVYRMLSRIRRSLHDCVDNSLLNEGCHE